MTKQHERDAIAQFLATRKPVPATITRKVTTRSIAGLSELAAEQMKRGFGESNDSYAERVLEARFNVRRNVERFA